MTDAEKSSTIAGSPPREVARLAHDLRQPLGAILLLASTIRGNSATPPNVVHVLERIEQHVREAANLCAAAERNVGDETGSRESAEAT